MPDGICDSKDCRPLITERDLGEGGGGGVGEKYRSKAGIAEVIGS